VLEDVERADQVEPTLERHLAGIELDQLGGRDPPPGDLEPLGEELAAGDREADVLGQPAEDVTGSASDLEEALARLGEVADGLGDQAIAVAEPEAPILDRRQLGEDLRLVAALRAPRALLLRGRHRGPGSRAVRPR
jgi:hypothetical protein